MCVKLFEGSMEVVLLLLLEIHQKLVVSMTLVDARLVDSKLWNRAKTCMHLFIQLSLMKGKSCVLFEMLKVNLVSDADMVYK